MADKNLERWIVARKKHKLSDKHVQMARELGLNPEKLGKIDNHNQEPWKAPLKEFIEDIYLKRFKKSEPENVRSIEQIIAAEKKKKEERKKRKIEKSSTTTLPMTDKEIILSFVKAINDHDIEKINDLMAEDNVFIDGAGNIHMGKEGMKIGWQSYYQMFPDYLIEISELIEHKSNFGLFGFASGTYTNNEDNSNCNFWRTTAAWKAIVENKKIKHWQVFCDYTRLMEIINKKIN